MGPHVKMEIFCNAKDIVNKHNQQPTDWKKIITNPTSDMGLISKIYEELKNLSTKSQTTQPKNEV